MEFKDLTPEQQEKFKACETLEEFAALAKENGFELTEEELQDIAGGTSTLIVTPPCRTKCIEKDGKRFKKSDYLRSETSGQ